MKRIFVKTYGFSEAERHALDTAFRLSESRETVYSPWTPEAAEAPDVVLIEGDSWQTVLALANPSLDALKLIWVGEDAPVQAWRAFPAPVRWPAVFDAMNEAFAVPTSRSLSLALETVHEEELDVHFEGNDDTVPMPLAPLAALAPARRVLVVDAGREERLYLRAKLAAAGLYDVDETASGSLALAFLRTRAYHLVIVDLGLTDMNSWDLIKAVDNTRPAIPHLFVTASSLAWHAGVRAWFSGARVCLEKPLHPGQLKALLQNL